MSRSCWEDKGERECLKDQPRRWGGRCASQMEWSVNSEASSRPPGPPPPPPRHRATPSPIDYRSESRRRHDNQGAGVAQGGAGPTHEPRPSLLGPPPPPFAGSWPIMPPPGVYPDTDRGPHAMPHYPQNRWGQAHPGYFQTARGQYAFDMKWWAQQKQSMDAYLGGPSWGDDGKSAHSNPDMPQWSFGTRVMKSSRRNYHGRPGYGGPRGLESGAYEEASHHHPRSSSSSSTSAAHPSSRSGRLGPRGSHHLDYQPRHDPGHCPADPRRQPHPSTHSQPPRSRDSSLDFRKKSSVERGDPRRSSSNPPPQGSKGSKWGKKSKKGKGGSWDVPGSFKSHSSPSKSIRPLSTNGALGVGRGGPSWPTHKDKKGKLGKASASYAEAAKKKALAAAANKLRRTFLASKKKGGSENTLLEEAEGNDRNGQSPSDDNNAQDLTMPRRHPSCLEFDIDIRFSSKEWASVGRGQGGTAGVLADPQGSSVLGKHLHKGDSLREEQEDSGTYSDTDVGRTDSHWSPPPGPDQSSSSSTRRRHLSESSGVIDLRKNPPSRGSTTRLASVRTRSCSMSLVEGGAGTSKAGEHGGSQPARVKLHLMPKLRRLMLKQLLSMDKKSLQELVDDPRSRKAQFMMTHLMSEHRAALSQRLAQQRFKTPDALPDDELQLLNSLEGEQLSSLPPEVVQQVREILALEQEGGEGGWEATTISLSDLLLHGGDSDQDCQIISPPPRDPASTITIHDTDSEMEELQEEDEEEDDDDEEEDEEGSSEHEEVDGHVNLTVNDESEMEEEEEEEEDDHELEDDEESKHQQQQEMPEDQVAPPALASSSSNSSGNSITIISSSISNSSNNDDATATSTAITTTTTTNNSSSGNEASGVEGNVMGKIEVPPTPPTTSGAAKPSPAAPPLPLLPQIPVEVPMCVMEPLAAGSSREMTGQVQDATLNLIGSPQQALSTQRPTGEIVPVPGPSSLLLKEGEQLEGISSPVRIYEVKEERPSPVSECGLCMHHPRTPHTSECVFPYGLAPPSPVTLMPGPPRPLGATSPQRPVPHIPPQPPLSVSLYQRSIKQEKLDESYLKFEHVKRPSSEERPKNPAPPDALPTLHPAAAPGLHPAPHPRPLIFSPDNDFPDPPRPPPPPPPQFSPRIKVERHTPVQFMCCCMRNECERNSSHSAEMRPPSHRAVATPQPSERRPTPHLYKMEPPSPCASRARTPHPPPPTHFVPPLVSPRSAVSGVEARVAGVEARVSIGVQTDREVRIPSHFDPSSSSRRMYIPNLSLARSVTPLSTSKVDQSTSTDDLPWEPFHAHHPQPQQALQQQLQEQQQQQQQQPQQQQPQQQQQRSKSRGKSWWWHRAGRPRNHVAQLAAISNSINNFEWSAEAGTALQQMAVLGEQEGELLRHAELLDQEVHDLLRERRRVTEELSRLQQLRAGKLRQLVQQGGSGQEEAEGPGPRGPTGDSRPQRVSQQDSSSDGGEPMEGANSSMLDPAETLSQRYGGGGRGDACVQSTTDNASVVSSSQEKTPRVRSFSFSHTSSNDSSNESQSVRRQRCTSTCHSPGRGPKSREPQEGHYQGSNSPGEYYQVGSGVGHLGLHPAANTDSETDNDTGALGAPVDSSEAKATVMESQNTARNRISSLSSSAEGDTESEAPGDHDEDDRISSLACKMSLDEGEAVVDSSERPDDNKDNDSSPIEEPTETSPGTQLGDPGPSKSQGLQKVEKMEAVGDTGPSLKSEESASSLTGLCTKSEPQDCPQRPVTPPPTSIHPPHPPSYFKSELKDVPQMHDAERLKTEEQESVPSSNMKCEDNMSPLNGHLPLASTSQGVSDRHTLINTQKKTCLSSSPSTSPMSSPESQKSRNTSSEHCYSLRSRGPPHRTRQVLQRTPSCSQEEEKKRTDKQPEEHQPGHSREKEDDHGDDIDSEDGGEDKKRKRKRKSKRHRFNKRKKKKLHEKAGKQSPRSVTDSSSKGGASPAQDDDTDEAMESSGDELAFVTPPTHGCAVLDIKVVGGYIVTASSDGTARCYDPASGQIMTTYSDHSDFVTCVGVVGHPRYDTDTKFLVVTGSADKSVCVFNGKTGEVQQKREVGEGVRCLDICWGQLFLGTDGGFGARWNFKDKGVTEMVQFCGNAVTSLKAMTEGGRRVLLVAAKTTPLMIRDAMTGLFLRTLEHIQLTVYATVSYGGLLYSGGSEKIIVYYDFTSGSSRGHLESEAAVSCLSVYKDYLVATCYDGLVRIFCLKTGKLLHRLSVETTNKMFICSALYKDRLLVGNKTGEVVECKMPPELKALPDA